MRQYQYIFLFILECLCITSRAQLNIGGLEGGGLVLTPAQANNANPAIDQVISIVNEVEEKQNYVDNLSGDSTISLPYGIIKQIGAARYVIAVDSMRFKENGAYFSAYAAIDFPGSTKKLAFRGSGIKFNPSGVIAGEQSRLYLASNHTLQINSNLQLQLNSNHPNWVEWDCGGFKAIRLSGNFVFSGTKLKPDHSVTSDTTVSASFSIYTEDIHNFIASVNITPFTIEGLNDWSFSVLNAVVDMSEISNAPSMIFPGGYNNPNLLTPQMWTGFYLQSAIVKLPRELSPPGKRTEVNVNNLVIDNTGLSGSLSAANLFNTSQGSMSGWGFSIDELGVSFVQNKLQGGSLKGKITLPAFDASESLSYNASINYNAVSKTVAYQFLVSPTSNLTMNAFSAKVTLNQNSFIQVVCTGSSFKPSANLCGTIGINHSRFSTNEGKLAFQNLFINTEAPYIHSGVFSLNSVNNTQSKAAKFPVSINSLSIGVINNAPVLGLHIALNLSDQSTNSLGVVTGVLIRGKIEPGSVTYQVGNKSVTYSRPSIKFDRISIIDVSLDIQTSPFTLKGQLIFREDDPVYGEGFFGNLQFTIPSIMKDAASSSVAFGAKDAYRYFYVDARVPVSFLLGSLPVRITRLTGGLYRNMKPGKTTAQELMALNQAPVTTGNSLSYAPDPAYGMGFKAGVSYEFAPNEVPFNGEMMLGFNFNTSGGLSSIGLQGDVYSMAKKVSRSTAPVKGEITISYDVPTKTFDALANVIINVQNRITGNGFFKMHIDPQTWFVCVGQPSKPNTINIGNVVTAPSYFMVGNTLEPPMAPPSDVAANSSVASVLGERNQSQLNSGGGFCAGARIQAGLSKNFGYSFFQVSATMSFVMGFDMMLANYGENAVCQGTSDKVGVNGWQAQGSMYLSFNANVSISGSLKLFGNCPKQNEVCILGVCKTITTPCVVNSSFNFPVFSGGACAAVAAKAPKPLYMTGSLNCNYNIFDRVSGSFKLEFSYGSDCTPVM